MKVYKVTVSFFVDSLCSEEQVQNQIENLFDYGTIKEAFSDANIDASYFSVDVVDQYPDT